MQLMTDSTEKTKIFTKIMKISALGGVILVFAFAVIYLGYSMGELLGSVIAAILASYLILPLARNLEKNMPKWLSALICVLLLYGSVIFVLVMLVPALIKQLSSASLNLSGLTGFANSIIDKLQGVADGLGIPVNAESILNDGLQSVVGSLSDIGKKAVEITISFFSKLPVISLIPILTFYFLKDREYFFSHMEFIIPVKWRGPIGNIAKSSDKTVKSYIRTQLVVALIVGGLTTLAYIVIKVPYALLLGIFMGLCEFIPYFGPVLGAIPACILILITSPEKIIWLIVAVIAIQQIEGSFLSPYLMGTHFNINPVTVIIVLWVSGRLFGFAGFIFAIPIYVILKDIFNNVFNKLVKAG